MSLRLNLKFNPIRSICFIMSLRFNLTSGSLVCLGFVERRIANSGSTVFDLRIVSLAGHEMTDRLDSILHYSDCEAYCRGVVVVQHSNLVAGVDTFCFRCFVVRAGSVAFKACANL